MAKSPYLGSIDIFILIDDYIKMGQVFVTTRLGLSIPWLAFGYNNHIMMWYSTDHKQPMLVENNLPTGEDFPHTITVDQYYDILCKIEERFKKPIHVLTNDFINYN